MTHDERARRLHQVYALLVKLAKKSEVADGANPIKTPTAATGHGAGSARAVSYYTRGYKCKSATTHSSHSEP